MYNETGIKKTMLISPEQDSRLKSYCKIRRISASMLFRLFIDELSVSELSSLKDEMKTATLNVNHFVSPNKNLIKEVIHTKEGNFVSRFFNNSRREIHNSFPKTNHY